VQWWIVGSEALKGAMDDQAARTGISLEVQVIDGTWGPIFQPKPHNGGHRIAKVDW